MLYGEFLVTWSHSGWSDVLELITEQLDNTEVRTVSASRRVMTTFQTTVSNIH